MDSQKALADIGKDVNQLGRQELRSLACAQCHVTYIVQKDEEMKSKAVFFPWQGSKPGDISVENIIKVIKSDPVSSGMEADGHRLQGRLYPPSGIRILQPEQRTLEGQRRLCRLPHALHEGGGQ